MTHIVEDQRMMVRIFVEATDEEAAGEVKENLKTKVAPIGDLMGESTRPYWKIRGYFEIVFELKPTRPVGQIFDPLLASLGDGWQLHGGGNEPDRWAIWNPGPTSTFMSPKVRWANVECFLAKLS